MREFKSIATHYVWQGFVRCKSGSWIRAVRALQRSAAANADATMQQFMDEALTDVDGWMA